ncbi:Acetyltransferase (GNAT) domain-containing protein [Desulforamulus aeronauticus DSM 10349]|uniref:Acetyltransferase (GNAT) domain-containing protein n=2 Tax=Desulforamulus aeronauticus TaxID=53343 RepID=A0A1M6QVY8_9FIRM|nr:Acetyltransferase (GNAT) domain-containing protein [Desulforamulus aeronauticus DSM 10349]
MKIRCALPDESEQLSSLALRSKKTWGYDDTFMEQCCRELTLSTDYIASSQVYVMEEKGEVLGFYGLSGKGLEGSLDFLFIEPSQMNCGYGKKLWLHAVKKAAELNFQYILIDSDPNAKGFYLAMGAKFKGEVSSKSIPGRFLPLFCFTIGR